MASEAAQSYIRNVKSMMAEEDLDEDEQQAADDLLTYLSGLDDVGGEEMKKIGAMLERIEKSKRGRHGMGWDI